MSTLDARLRAIEEKGSGSSLVVLVRSMLGEPARIVSGNGATWVRLDGESAEAFRQRAEREAGATTRGFVCLQEQTGLA